ncbi:hypothetical protein [Paenibacillus taichungensis]|nr:hypothetical protein [Paenibacillus taichungensis]MDR9746995.1 hypothetical protein [Paenibacillus taichungensis]
MIDPLFQTQTESQLNLLSEISTISATMKIDFWLRGGWQLIFY